MAEEPIKEFDLPEGMSSPGALAIAPGGTVWFAEKVGKNLVSFEPGKQEFKIHPLPESWGQLGLAWITVGIEGEIWFTVRRWAENVVPTDLLGRFNPVDGTFQSFKVPELVPEELIVDASGAVWFLTNDQLFRFDPENSKLDGYMIPTPDSHPRGLALDGAGDLWFAEANANKIAGFSTEKKVFSEVEINIPFFNPSGLAVDGLGNVWFTGINANKLAVYYPGTGKFNYIDIPTPMAIPNWITHDDEGGIWFLEYGGNKVGLFDAKEATFKEFDVPTFRSLPDGLAVDNKNGVLWFSETGTEARRLGRVSIKAAKAMEMATGRRGEAGGESSGRGLLVIAAIVLALGAVGGYLLHKRKLAKAGRSGGPA